MNATNLKTGKKPATHDPRDLQFAHYLIPGMPERPAVFGWNAPWSDDGWGMLGNDQYGDCVFAGADHETMLWNAQSDKQPEFRDEDALADYGAVTGFSPDDPNSDQGTNVRDAMKYRYHTGLRDASGARHKIGAYVALEPGNIDHVEEAMYLFGAVGIGIEFPESAMTQFNNEKPWSVVSGAQVEGGHYIPLVAVRKVGRRHDLECVTWGRVQPMTRGFYEKYCDEAWGILSPEMMKGGISPGGFDMRTLNADLNALKA